MNSFAINIQNVSKTFRIYHEQRSSIRENIFNIFKKGRYEDFYALQNITCEIKKGEFFGIIGRNGSGKSTLLKILAGVYIPDKGTVETNGKISPFLELGVGFNGELTAAENIYLNGAILGLSRKQIKERFQSIIDFAELERFVDTKLKNYSSGMYTRLAFSLAIQVDADILIMDEVLAVGDMSFQEKCFTKFREFKQQGKTVILVSHGMGSIEEFCDRAMVISQGNIKYLGDTKTAIQTYESLP